MIRLLHSADLHLGMPFGQFDDDLSGTLRAARSGLIARLSAAARANDVSVVLLAGDTFHAENPKRSLIVQTCQEIAEADDLVWYMMPGNHDSLAGTELWDQLARLAPPNLRLVTDAVPVALAENAYLLPAPCTHRRPGADLTVAMDQATPEGALRIGLGHGPVQTFSESSVVDIIPPDRATRSGLEYLALGDWHGQMAIGPRSYYAGTPEPERFPKGNLMDAVGQALIVSLDAVGAMPDVTPVVTGEMVWSHVQVDLTPQIEVAPALEAVWPAPEMRRKTLIALTALGTTGLAGRAALTQAVELAADQFAYLEADFGDLTVLSDASDLDLIAKSGALRAAAQALVARGDDPALSAADRAVARDALTRLFTYAEIDGT